VRLWDVANGRDLHLWRDAHDMGGGFALSPDGRHIVLPERLTPWDFRLKLWETATGGEAGTFFGELSGPTSVAFSPDGKFIVTAGGSSDIKLWDVAARKEVRRLRSLDSVIKATFSRDGRSIVVGTDRGVLVAWDVATGKEIKRYSAPARQVTATRFSPDGRFILSGSGRAVRLWEAATGKLLRTYVGLPDGPVLAKDSLTGENTIIGDGVSTVAFSSDGRLALASLGGLGTLVRRWEVATGKEVTAFVSRMPHTVAFSADGRFAYIGDTGVVRGALLRWDMDTRQHVAFPGAAEEIRGLSLSQDGRLLLSGGRQLQFWDAAAGKELAFARQGAKEPKDLKERLLRGGPIQANQTAVALSPDGRLALSASTSRELDLWDTATGDLVRTLKGHTEWVGTLAFSPDGRTALSGDGDGLLKLWDIAAGKELKTLRGHVGRVGSVAFAADGRRAVSGAEDGAVRVWDLEQGRELAALFAAAEDDWLAITPYGFFSASRRDTDMLALVSDAGVTTMGQVHKSLFNPDLVREALAGDGANEVEGAARVVNLEKVLEGGPPPSVEIATHPPGTRSTTATVAVSARVTDRGKGIGRIEWRVNGITVGVMGVSVGGGPVHDVQRTLALDPGDNRVEVIAYEARNLLASPPAHTTSTLSRSLPRSFHSA
jgi:WD40 repeat protein